MLVQEMQAFDDVKSNRGAFAIPMQLSRCLSQRLPQVPTLHPYTLLCKPHMGRLMLELDKHAKNMPRTEQNIGMLGNGKNKLHMLLSRITEKLLPQASIKVGDLGEDKQTCM